MATENKPEESKKAPKVLQIDLKDRSMLYLAYIPIFRNGGVFIPTKQEFKIGDEVYLLLNIPDDPKKYPIAGTVGWINPRGASGHRTQGIGICFPGDNKSNELKYNIEKILGVSLASTKPTFTV